MLELPEALTLARQLGEALQGKRIVRVIAGHAPHRFAWFNGDPAAYDVLLKGRTVGATASHGGFVEVDLSGDALLAFSEGVALRLHGAGVARPVKHQLLVDFEDGTALSASVQMYGGLWAVAGEPFDNPYYRAARSAPSPFTKGFDRPHCERLVAADTAGTLSLKGLLATEQRIPGFGNGVLQDVLFEAGLHPRRRVASLTGDERDRLFACVVGTLGDMARSGGRDTERDLYGRAGGYLTRLSRHTVGRPCPRCGAAIVKEAYLGGAVYTCPGCQPNR